MSGVITNSAIHKCNAASLNRLCTSYQPTTGREALCTTAARPMVQSNLCSTSVTTASIILTMAHVEQRDDLDQQIWIVFLIQQALQFADQQTKLAACASALLGHAGSQLTKQELAQDCVELVLDWDLQLKPVKISQPCYSKATDCCGDLCNN